MKKQHLGIFEQSNIEKESKESLKTIFYLAHYASLLSKANFKVDHTHCSKFCLLECTISLEKQHFRIFQHSNIRSENRRVRKNHFLCISVKVSKFQNRPRSLLKTVPVQMHYFPWKSTFSNFPASYIRNESRWVNKSHFLSYTLPISVKVSEVKNWTRPLFKTVSVQMHCFPWKSTFSNFPASNIRNESRWVNKNNFFSYILPISVKASEFQNRPSPLFKTVPVQMHYFP